MKQLSLYADRGDEPKHVPPRDTKKDVVLDKIATLTAMVARIGERLESPRLGDPVAESEPEEQATSRALRRANGLTHLSVDPRTGNYLWRRWDETKGRRIVRSTKTPDQQFAIQIGAKFELDYQRRRAGLAIFDDYTKPLLPAAEHWIKSLDVTDQVRRQMDRQIRRALEKLKLTTFADLDDIQRLERNLLALEGTRGKRKIITRLTLRTGFQKILKQFSKWCAQNRRYLPQDPLAQWVFVKVPDTLPRKRRRAVSPAEMARTLMACDALDRIYGRDHPTSIVFLSLLITGSRFGAFSQLDVPQLLQEGCRLDLGAGVGKKRRGEASLDAKTFIEISAYLGERKEGALFLSPKGDRLDEARAIDVWREAFTFALVDELWPDAEARCVELVHLVTRVLICGKMPTVGGNPRRLRVETVRARQDQEAFVRRVADRVRPSWEARMVGIDLHALRKTHRTWAEAAGVHPILIDKQLGHSTAAGSAAIDVARSLLVSPTGRKHYVDMTLEMIEARRSAEAVRSVLEGARADALKRCRPTVFTTSRCDQTPRSIIDLPAATRVS
jgi:hypothetical protein